MRLENSLKSATPRFLFDSGGFNGEGVSLYITNEQLIGQVADKKRVWKVSNEFAINPVGVRGGHDPVFFITIVIRNYWSGE